MAALDKAFTATLRQSRERDGRTYVVMPDSARLLGTKGRVKVTGMVDGRPFITSFMALGDGNHKLPVNAAVRSAISKQPGDTVTVFLKDRLDR